jgi:hypothetical protein
MAEHGVAEEHREMIGRMVDLLADSPTEKYFDQAAVIVKGLLKELGEGTYSNWLDTYTQHPQWKHFYKGAGRPGTTADNNCLESNNDITKHHHLKDNLRSSPHWLLNEGFQMLLNKEGLRAGGFKTHDGVHISVPYHTKLPENAPIKLANITKKAHNMLLSHKAASSAGAGGRGGGGGGGHVQALKVDEKRFYVNSESYMDSDVTLERVRWHEVGVNGGEEMQVSENLSVKDSLVEFKRFFASLHKLTKEVVEPSTGRTDWICDCRVSEREKSHLSFVHQKTGLTRGFLSFGPGWSTERMGYGLFSHFCCISARTHFIVMHCKWEC